MKSYLVLLSFLLIILASIEKSEAQRRGGRLSERRRNRCECMKRNIQNLEDAAFVFRVYQRQIPYDGSWHIQHDSAGHIPYDGEWHIEYDSAGHIPHDGEWHAFQWRIPYDGERHAGLRSQFGTEWDSGIYSYEDEVETMEGDRCRRRQCKEAVEAFLESSRARDTFADSPMGRRGNWNPDVCNLFTGEGKASCNRCMERRSGRRIRKFPRKFCKYLKRMCREGSSGDAYYDDYDDYDDDYSDEDENFSENRANRERMMREDSSDESSSSSSSSEEES